MTDDLRRILETDKRVALAALGAEVLVTDNAFPQSDSCLLEVSGWNRRLSSVCGCASLLSARSRPSRCIYSHGRRRGS
jgi:hypothetical protein